MRTLVHRATAALAVAALAAGLPAAAARADGDPASDVLASLPLFVPQDSSVTPARHAQLDSLLRAARRAGYPVRVALIASPSDLGSVGELWHQPQAYARFLAAELTLVYRGPLLIVMPNGYGVAGTGAKAAALRGARAPGGDLAGAAVDGVARLAAASGHHVAIPAQSQPESPDGSTDALAWIVFVLGAVAIAAAWVASLRARRLRLGGGGGEVE